MLKPGKRGIAFETIAKMIIAIVVMVSVIAFAVWVMGNLKGSVSPITNTTQEQAAIQSICYQISLGNYNKACKMIKEYNLNSEYCEKKSYSIPFPFFDSKTEITYIYVCNFSKNCCVICSPDFTSGSKC